MTLQITSASAKQRVRRPNCAALTATAATLLLLATVACDSENQSATPSDSATATPAPTTAVIFTSRAGASIALIVEVADTPEERSRGLMGRESVPEGAGMLFIWPEDTASGFWMKDTLVPLSVAFIDAAGTVLDIQDMQPLDETLRQSPDPYRYGVEVNQGWFAEHGISAGDTVTIPDDIR